MKLRAIYHGYIREGLHPHSFDGLTPDSLRKAKAPKVKGAKKKPGEDVGELYRTQEFRHREEDDPADLVKLKPLLTSTKLNVVPAGAQARSSFQGARIYYGFSVDLGAQDQMVKALGQQAGGDLWSDIADITTDPVLGTRPGVVEDKADADDLIEHSRAIEKYALMNCRDDPERGKQFQDLAAKCRTAAARMNEKGFDTLKELRATSQPTKDDEDLGIQHNRHAGLSLAGKIKEPVTPEEKQMSEKVIDLAAGYWARMKPGGYDLIAYPQSSTPFNGHFIAALRKFPGYAQAEVVELKELLAHEARIDVEDISSQAMQEHERAAATGKASRNPIEAAYLPGGDPKKQVNPEHLTQFHAAGLELNMKPKVDAKGNLPVTDPDWVEWRTALTVAQLEGKLSGMSDTPAVKNLGFLPKQFIDMFSKEGLDAAGKRVLVVDDNVAYSATMQILNHMIVQQNPLAVDLYTPFYMGK